MPDVQLFDLRDARDGLHVLVGEPVTGVHGEAALPGVRGRARQRAQCRVAAAPGARVATGVQLDRGHAQLGRTVDRREVGVDEQAHADAGVHQAPHGGPDPTVGAMQGEAAFGGDLLASLRDERRLKRLHPARDAHDLVVRTQLDVEHGAQRRGERAHVAILNVPPVFAQMDRDAVGAGALRRVRRAHRIGLVGLARLAQCRHVINVDVQPHAALPSVHSVQP